MARQDEKPFDWARLTGVFAKLMNWRIMLIVSQESCSSTYVRFSK